MPQTVPGTYAVIVKKFVVIELDIAGAAVYAHTLLHRTAIRVILEDDPLNAEIAFVADE
jgi:hypothetical protein